MENKYKEKSIVKLSNDKLYVISSVKEINNRKYASLITAKDPLEILLAEIVPTNDDGEDLRIIANRDEKIAMLKAFFSQE